MNKKSTNYFFCQKYVVKGDLFLGNGTDNYHLIYASQVKRFFKD